MLRASNSIMVSATQSTVVSGEFMYTFKNRNYIPNNSVPGFIYIGAYSAGAWNSVGAGFIFELARRGYPVIAGDVSDTPTAVGKTDGPGSWGADISRTRLGLYKTYLQTIFGAKTGPVGLLYGSGGCPTAYGYAQANPTHVFCIAGGIGACDVEDIRANNLAGGAASIEAKYTDNATWQAARPTHNPVEFASTLTIPQLDYYSTDDPLCRPATHAALGVAAAGHITQVSMGAISHSFNGLNFRDSAETKAFVDWCVAQVPA